MLALPNTITLSYSVENFEGSTFVSPTTQNETFEEKKVTQISNFENHSENEIERVVIFFKNGTFKSYTS